MASKLHNVVFVLGPPGSGKGTQCERIQKTFGYVHLSAGQLLRDERDSPNSEFGQLIETHITNGSIVPVEITCSLLERAMDAAAGAPGFLVDGFPRNEDNNAGWNKQMEGKAKVKFVLFIECATDRCLGRGQGRSDDNEQSLQKRITTYKEHTQPIIQLYQKLSLVRQIDGKKTADEVFEDVKRCFAES